MWSMNTMVAEGDMIDVTEGVAVGFQVSTKARKVV